MVPAIRPAGLSDDPIAVLGILKSAECTFWELVDEILNALLFVLIGLEVLVLTFAGDTCNFVRALGERGCTRAGDETPLSG